MLKPLETCPLNVSRFMFHLGGHLSVHLGRRVADSRCSHISKCLEVGRRFYSPALFYQVLFNVIHNAKLQ